MSSARPRALLVSDIPSMLALAAEAGWNQTAADIESLLRLAPAGCFGIDCDGSLAATTTLVPVNRGVAWLGMVLTGGAYRRRGFARLLVEHALEHAGRLGMARVKLDATEMGRPLYASLGFRDEQPIERWAGRLTQLSPDAGPAYFDNPLLHELALRSDVFAHPGGYLFVRAGMRARYIGPFVAAAPEAAQALVRDAFQTSSAGDLHFWDVLPHNKEAIRLLEQLGFERVRSLVRMVRGPDLPGADEPSVYAIKGFELG